VENKSLRDSLRQSASLTRSRASESLESKMANLDPFARRSKSIRWRVLETFVRTKTRDTARDDTWTGIQIDKDLTEEGNMTAHNGCITADVVMVRDDL